MPQWICNFLNSDFNNKSNSRTTKTRKSLGRLPVPSRCLPDARGCSPRCCRPGLLHTAQGRARPGSARARQSLPVPRRGGHSSSTLRASQLRAQTYESCSRRGYFQSPLHLLGKRAIINSAAACLSLMGHHQVGAISTSLGFQNNYARFCHIKMSFICNSQASYMCNTTLPSTPVPII